MTVIEEALREYKENHPEVEVEELIYKADKEVYNDGLLHLLMDETEFLLEDDDLPVEKVYEIAIKARQAVIENETIWELIHEAIEAEK